MDFATRVLGLGRSIFVISNFIGVTFRPLLTYSSILSSHHSQGKYRCLSKKILKRASGRESNSHPQR